MTFPMHYGLSFLLIIALLAPKAWALEPIPEVGDPHFPDTISKSLLSQIKSDFEDPVNLVCSQVEAIIEEIDKMALASNEENSILDKIEKPDFSFSDHVRQVTHIN
ncbi:MAG: hypothetical protein LBG98_03680 [Puniceicoccales bacterium]|jgi:hypothetical protein|nr:hypothetical protein [Puniceicoccales bacterium]